MTDQMQIAAVTTRRPFGVDTSQSYTDSGTIIVSDAWLDAHDPQGGAKITVKYASTDPGTLTQALEKTYDFYPEEIRNRDLQNRENNMLLFVDGIALYGFLLAVLLIGVTNICNTVLTDLWQRRREFVILRSVGMTPTTSAMPICRSGTLPIGAPGIGRYRHRKGRMRHESSCV